MSSFMRLSNDLLSWDQISKKKRHDMKRKRKFSESTNQISFSRSRFIDWWQWVEPFGWNGTDWVGISWEQLIHPERAIMFGFQKANSNYRAEISLISNVGEFPKSHATRMCSLLCCLRIGLQCKYFRSQHQRANRNRRQRKYLPCDMTMMRVVATSLISRTGKNLRGFSAARQSISKRH